jgi:ribA/ribD-fused uncharacterized protein
MILTDPSDIAFTKVKLPYGWLSNMAPFPIQAEGRIWRTSEALFQALRFTDPACIDAIHEATSPMVAKMVAKANGRHRVVEPWSTADVGNMHRVLRLKIEQHPELKFSLLATHGRIIEDCTLRPVDSALFWGARRSAEGWIGKNMLGVLWMGLREELRQVVDAQTTLDFKVRT